MTLYDTIGQKYTQTRRSAPRILAALLQILSLSPGSTVADIGAGTGSYALALAERGYQILAVEPSATMRNQAAVHPAIHWIDAYADNLLLRQQQEWDAGYRYFVYLDTFKASESLQSIRINSLLAQ